MWSFFASSKRHAAQAPQRWFITLSLVLLLGLSACTQIRLPGQSGQVNLSFNVAASAPGSYQVTGQSNLPDDTPIAVAAVRYLQPIDNLASDGKSYSILDYQETTVKQGQWQAQLNLWRTAADGKLQEAWQLEQAKLKISLASQPEVMFLATPTAPNGLAKLETELAKRNMRLDGRTIRSTREGDRFVLVSQVMPLELPTGQTAAPSRRPEDINDGWGNRYLILPEPPNPIQLERPIDRQTNAPASPDEFLR